MACSLNVSAKDCEWDTWITGTCSATCGKEGVRDDKRKKISEAENGGKCDEKQGRRTIKCNNVPCPSKSTAEMIFHMF